MISCAISLRRFAGMTQPLQRDRFGLDPLAEPRFHLRAEIDFEAQERFQLARRLRYWRQDVRDWLEERRDESGDGAARVVQVPSAVAGTVTRWRARYVDNAGREHSRTFDRKVDAQKWLDTQLAALLRGDHVAPRDARLTVGEWCDKWLAGYGTRRASTVRMAEVHLKIIKAHFGSVPLSAVKPSDLRAWTATLKAEGRADSYVYALHSRLSQLFTDAVHDGLVTRNPCSRRTSPGMGKQRPYVATTKQVWALYEAVPPGVRPAILLGAHAGLRLAEAAALRVTDVDFASRLLTPLVQWVDEPLKSDTSRTPIPVPVEMAQLLAQAILLGNGTHIVSDQWGDAGGPWTIERACAPPGLASGCRMSSGSTTCGTTSRRSSLPRASTSRSSRPDSGTPRRRRPSTPTATSGRTGTTPHAPRWRLSIGTGRELSRSRRAPDADRCSEE